MVKFRVWDSFKSIKEIEIERETEKSIWIDGSRSNKSSQGFYQFFDTKKECVDFLIKTKKDEIQSIRLNEERLLNKRIKLRDEIIKLERGEN